MSEWTCSLCSMKLSILLKLKMTALSTSVLIFFYMLECALHGLHFSNIILRHHLSLGIFKKI